MTKLNLLVSTAAGARRARFGCVVAALAAGALVSSPASAKSDGESDWSGPYVGFMLGYASGDDEATEIDGPRFYIPESEGFTGALQLGWQKQMGGFVAGLEGELGYADAESSMTADVDGGTITSGATLGLYGSLAAKAGVTLGRDTLLFGKAGIAVGELDGVTTQTCTLPGLCGGAQSTEVSSAVTESPSWGVVLGAGLEHRFSDRVSGRIDYQFTGYREELALPEVDGPGWNHDVDLHAIRAGLSVHF